MNRRGAGRRMTESRAGLRILRLVAVLAMLLGTLAAAPLAAAQSDGEAGTYVSPTFGYTLAWDPNDWTVEDEREPTGQSTRDFLRLSTNDADREGLVTGIVFIEGTDQDWSDPDDCVRTLAREIDVRPSRDEPIEDPETGEPFEISGDDRSAAAYIQVSEDENGDEVARGAMFDCRADPNSDLIVAFTNVSAYTTGYFDEAYPAFAALVDALTLPGGDAIGPDKGDVASGANPSPGRSGGGKPGPDSGAASPSDGGSEPAPSEAPNASDGPAASDEPIPTSDDPTAFAADEFGVTLNWDPAVWTYEGEERGEGYAAVRLSSELLTTAFVPYVSGDGSVTTCLDNYVGILNERGAGTAAIVVRPDGQPDITVSSDQTQLEAYVAYADKDVPFESRIRCTSLSATDVLAAEFTGPAADLRGDEATAQIDDLLTGLRIEGA